MSPLQVFAWIAALTAGMLLLAHAIGWMRGTRREALTAARRILVLGIGSAFFLWPHLTAPRVVVSAALAAAVVLATRRLVRARAPSAVESAPRDLAAE